MKQTIKEYIDKQNDFVTYYLMNTEMTVTEIRESIGLDKKRFLRDIKEQRNGVLEVTLDNIDELLEDADNDTRLVARCCAYDPSKVVSLYMAKHFGEDTVLDLYVNQSMKPEEVAMELDKPFVTVSTVKNLLQTTHKDYLKTVERKTKRRTKEEIAKIQSDYKKHVEDNPLVFHSIEMGAPVVLKGAEKSKKFYQDKYGEGITNGSQVPEIKEKMRQTNLKRYGTEYAMQNKEFIEGVHQRHYEKYGVRTPMERPEVVEKMLSNREKNHGSRSYHNMEKMIQTNLERYGVEQLLTLREFQDKTKNGMINKYGEPHVFNIKEFNDALVKKRLEKKFTPTKYIKNFEEYLKLRDNPEIVQELINNYLADNNETAITRETLRESILGLDNTSQPKILRFSGYTGIKVPHREQQKELFEYVTSLVPDLDYKTEYRPKYMGRKELDLYFPELNLAFEFNGTIWHSDAFKDSDDYHQKKSELANKNDVKIVHVYSDDWEDNREQVNELIKNSLEVNKTLTEDSEVTIAPISNTKAERFINTNSLYDFPNATSYKAVFEDDEGLCAVIPFDDVNNFMYEPVNKHGLSVPYSLVSEERDDYSLAINLDYNNLYDNAATQQGLELEDIKLDRSRKIKSDATMYLAGTAYFK